MEDRKTFMVTKNQKAEMLKQYMEIAIALLLTTSFTVVKTPKIILQIQENLVNGLFSLVLFIITCAFLLGWVYVDIMEIRLTEEYINTKKARVSTSPLVSAFLLGISAGFLISLTDMPIIYIGILLVVFVTGTFGTVVVRRNLQILIPEKARNFGVRGAIYEYYMKKPIYRLDFCAYAGLLIGFGLALFSWINDNQLCFILSYIMAILSLVGHEVIVWSWRIKRNRKIAIAEEFNELFNIKESELFIQ
jgi:hypothetical protein